ncbi:MAG TPA: PTS sugar transporter subunit IIA [Terriglobales bacterium]|nr:PTS sugar transporter subunit IIA [Terriglobales bacterium]
MKISNYLAPGRISPDFSAKSKPDAVQGLLKMMTANEMLAADKVPDVQLVILEREALTSTGLGYGLAIPHARTELVAKIQVVFARSPRGVEFEALDGNPVHFLFLVLAPARCADEYLKLISSISSLMKNENVRKQLLSAKSREDILRVFDQ